MLEFGIHGHNTIPAVSKTQAVEGLKSVKQYIHTSEKSSLQAWYLF